MDIDELLRSYAIQDLRRFFTTHYLWREHKPEADIELVQPLLAQPIKHGLTPREHVAAKALSSLATYRIKFQEIIARSVGPARDIYDTTTTVNSFTAEMAVEIGAWREYFREPALIYAKMIGDKQLIDEHQPKPTKAAPEIRKRSALINEDKSIWPTIEGDMGDANRNELNVAKASRHGYWKVEPALEWAKREGKIAKKKAQTFVESNGDNELSLMLRQMFNF